MQNRKSRYHRGAIVFAHGLLSAALPAAAIAEPAGNFDAAIENAQARYSPQHADIREAAIDSVDVFQSAGDPDPSHLETQLLRGEAVRVLETSEGWAKIEAIDQLKPTSDNPKAGYPGWALESQLRAVDPADLAAHFKGRSAVPLDQVREKFMLSMEALAAAETPYLWGGRSEAGVDCSGSIHLSLTRLGYGSQVPRDSKDMARFAQPVQSPKRGDLVFFAFSGRVHHVAVYAGDGVIIEALSNVRRVPLADHPYVVTGSDTVSYGDLIVKLEPL